MSHLPTLAKVGILHLMKSSGVVKNVDSKGRISLGESFANSTVLVEERDGELIIKRAVVLPAREAWLYANERALDSLRRGLSEAADGQFAKGPDLKVSAKLAEQLLDD